MNQVSIIAAIGSDNVNYASINIGKNNSHTFQLFLFQLCLILDKKDPTWRSTHLIMIDNASYHRSSQTQETIRMLKLKLLYSGPYSYNLSPAEKFFALLK